jgi:pyruvate/2-oxoglutarate/acetoin dehydrogenase E1 component
MPDREITFAQAVREATDLCMAEDPTVYLMGLGVPDPKGVFGTTLGLQEKYGPDRVFDVPTSENAMTGVAIGSALVGMRPILVHQRLDFALLSMEQIVNQAANWHYMFGGRGGNLPLVIRLVVGRGWGQGPQHSQSLQAWFAHVPGLKVVMPTVPYDAKGLLIASIQDNNPVIFIEHRWLHNVKGHVPEGAYSVPLGAARVVREGNDVTIASTSYMTLEALQAAEAMSEDGIEAEVLDIRTLRPLDQEAILNSVVKTGRLIVADTGWKSFGIGAEVVALTAERAFAKLKHPPHRIGLPDCPSPSTPAIANRFYPRAAEIVSAGRAMFGLRPTGIVEEASVPEDIPDPSFAGPF